jgi:post-segregation antitoxin (ccd killing protein)
MTEVITVRIDEETKGKLKRHRINVSETVRKALKEEIGRRERAELVEAIASVQPILKKIPKVEWVGAVRESREQR